MTLWKKSKSGEQLTVRRCNQFIHFTYFGKSNEKFFPSVTVFVKDAYYKKPESEILVYELVFSDSLRFFPHILKGEG